MIKIFQTERLHGLPTVAEPTFFPTVSRNRETWWERREGDIINMGIQLDEQSEDDSEGTEYMRDSADEHVKENMKKTAYIWDSMHEADRDNPMNTLKHNARWVI